MGISGVSDITPGCPGHIECDANHFAFEEDDSWETVLYTLHNTARDCPDFEPRE